MLVLCLYITKTPIKVVITRRGVFPIPYPTGLNAVRIGSAAAAIIATK